MTDVHIRDVAGVVHTVSFSDDPRPVAMDSLPPGMRRRPGRDQEELPALPDRLDGDTAVVCISEVLKRVSGDPREILATVQRNLDRSNGEDGDDAAAFSVPKPRVSAVRPPAFPGRPRDSAASDRLPAMDSSLARRDPVLAGYLSKIRTYGY